MLCRQQKRESLHLLCPEQTRQKEARHGTLKLPFWRVPQCGGGGRRKARLTPIASHPLLNCFEKQLSTAAINWAAGMLHGRENVF